METRKKTVLVGRLKNLLIAIMVIGLITICTLANVKNDQRKKAAYQEDINRIESKLDSILLKLQ